MKKLLSVSALLLLSSALAFSQGNTGGVKGVVINRNEKAPVSGAHLTLYSGDAQVAELKSDEEGAFSVGNLANGMYTLRISAPDYLESNVQVTVNDGYVKNMFNLSLTPIKKVEEIEDATMTEFDMEDSGYNDNPSILFATNDVFNSVAGYNFSAIRFRVRGYASESQVVTLAGVKMNDAMTGYGAYSLWSGLNEAARAKDVVTGAEVSDYGFGGYNGLTNVFGNASSFRKGLRARVLTNSALYRLNVAVSYASGRLDNGWSYAFNVSTRLGGNDWVQGQYYRSFGYYAGVEKSFGSAHNLGLAIMAAPGERGAQNSSTQEVYDLMGDNMYNSNWGYQNGKMRNARVRKTHEPITFLKYDFTPSDRFQASATLLYRFGKNGYTALDWYDSYDPRPDYYRNLPSYFYNPDARYSRLEPEKAFWTAEGWLNHDPAIAHVNWDGIYQVNRASGDTDKTGLGNRSRYVQEERHTDQQDLNLALSAKWRPADFVTVTGGINGKMNRTEYYKTIADLLGGSYYVDIDSFAERDYASCKSKVQNNLDYYNENGHPRYLGVGHKYGYDYYAHVQNLDAWVNGAFKFGAFSASVAGKVGVSRFWREGLLRKGLFPGLDAQGNPIRDKETGEMLTTYDPLTGQPITSYGNSAKSTFLVYAGKLNLAYEFGGNQRVYANVGYFNDAPTFSKAFLSPRTRNSLVPNLKTAKTFTADLNYQLSGNGYNVRATAFYTTIKDQTDVMSFYDDLQNAFTNFALSGIGQRHMGVELGFKVPLPVSNLSLQGVVSWGEYIYTTNPYMTQTVDNSSDIIINNEIVPRWKSHNIYKRDAEGNITSEVDHVQKHYVPSTPQLATSLGLSYNYKYWFIDLDAEYFANSYLSMNPLYRTTKAILGPDKDMSPIEEEYMCAQEKFNPAFLVNLSIGKSWFINRHQLGFSLNVRNLLNNRGVKTGGYEQNRLIDDYAKCYFRFDSKYFYMPGINYMLNVYFRF